MEIQDANKTLRGILEKKKLSETDKETIRGCVGALFETPKGVEILTKVVTPRSKQVLKKVLCESVVSKINAHMKGLPEKSEDLKAYVEMLQGIIKGQNIDMRAKWMAIRLLRSVSLHAGNKLFKEALEAISPRQEIVQKYERCIKGYMGPDAGLETLETLRTSDYEPFWLQQLIRAVRGWNRGREHLLESRRPEIEHPGLEKEKESIDVSEKVGHREPSDLPESRRKKERDSEPRLPSPVDFLAYLESGIAQLRTIAKEHVQFKDQIEGLRNEIRFYLKETSELKIETKDLKTQRDQLEQAHREALEKVKQVESQMEAVKNRARQDVNILRAEKKSEVKTFSYNLWRRIEKNFTEVMDPNLDMNRFPISERILLKQLKHILKELRDLNIVPENEGRRV